MSTAALKPGWYVEFWDFGTWNVLCGGPFDRKPLAVAAAQSLNRNTDHQTRNTVFEGHRFRVRFRGLKARRKN